MALRKNDSVSAVPVALMESLERSGVTAWYSSRGEYGERLDQFFARASHSIEIVAITCRLASAEGDICAVFRRKLRQRMFCIRLSLLDPRCAAVDTLARSVGVGAKDLAIGLAENLGHWHEFARSLDEGHRVRFDLRVHNCLPFGSAYLLDASTQEGVIHVETSLYMAPKDESFGFQVAGPSDFFNRNCRAWRGVIDAGARFEVG